MAREIKIRAWDVGEKKWRTNLNFYMDSNNENDVVFISGVASNGLEIMQFTGLKDKNGTDIYEGDIVWDWMYKKNRLVKWSNENLCWMLVNLSEDEDSINREKKMDLFNDIDLKIVGNVFQNPEILGGQNARG